MDEFAEINITPFTDVLLVLLIIFMMMAALLAPIGFEQQIGCHCGGTTPARIHFNANLTIARSGAMTLDGRAADVRSIYAMLATLHRAHPDASLSISSDAKTPYGAVIRAVDAAKSSSITNVTFITQ